VLQVDGLHLVAWLRQEVLTTQLKPMLGRRFAQINSVKGRKDEKPIL